jgi:hypothetical protein
MLLVISTVSPAEADVIASPIVVMPGEGTCQVAAREADARLRARIDPITTRKEMLNFFIEVHSPLKSRFQGQKVRVLSKHRQIIVCVTSYI